MDGDGDVDFAAAFNGNSSGWFENHDRTWAYHGVTPTPGSEPDRNGRDIVPIDFDRDGDFDLVALAALSNQLALDLYRNDGHETFTRETLASTTGFSSTLTTTGGDRLQVADLDGDGDFDAVANAAWGTRVYRNDGPAGFTQFLAPGTSVSSSESAPVAVGDFDGDGRLEILASNGFGGSTFRLDDLLFGDYNREGKVDQADRDLYDATIGQPAMPPGSGADGDRSGVVDPPDLAIWEANQGRGTPPLVRAADFDQNEVIDGNDFLRWQLHFGETSMFPGTFIEDADPNAVVDGGDLEVWVRHFGQGVHPAATATTSAAAASAESFSSATMVLAVAASETLISTSAQDAAPVRSVAPNLSPLPSVVAKDAALAYITSPRSASIGRPKWRPWLSSSADTELPRFITPRAKIFSDLRTD
jgi:hypothetical protein